MYYEYVMEDLGKKLIPFQAPKFCGLYLRDIMSIQEQVILISWGYWVEALMGRTKTVAENWVSKQSFFVFILTMA